MLNSPGREGPAAEKKKKKQRTKRGRWTPAQRQKIVAAIYVAGASINEAAEAHHASGGNTAYASWTTP
jgi:transposase-like protein